MPSSKRCHAFGCGVRRTSDNPIKLHSFPRNDFLCAEWVKRANNPALMGRPANKVSNYAYLCERHFSADQYQCPLKKKLHIDATPSIFPGSEAWHILIEKEAASMPCPPSPQRYPHPTQKGILLEFSYASSSSSSADAEPLPSDDEFCPVSSQAKKPMTHLESSQGVVAPHETSAQLTEALGPQAQQQQGQAAMPVPAPLEANTFTSLRCKSPSAYIQVPSDEECLQLFHAVRDNCASTKLTRRDLNELDAMLSIAAAWPVLPEQVRHIVYNRVRILRIVQAHGWEAALRLGDLQEDELFQTLPHSPAAPPTSVIMQAPPESGASGSCPSSSSSSRKFTPF